MTKFILSICCVLLLGQINLSQSLWPETWNDASVKQNDEESQTYTERNKQVAIELEDLPGEANDYSKAEEIQTLDNFEFSSPVQAPFIDAEKWPTESQRPDPKFQTPPDCQPDQYKCLKVDETQVHIRCIPNNWKCNGMRDCELNDDEQNCAQYSNSYGAPTDCAPDQHKCYATGVNNIPVVCIDKRRVCDSIQDCSYSDDEANCAGKILPNYDTQQQPTRPQPQPTQAPSQSDESRYYNHYPEPSRSQPSFTTAEVNCPPPYRSDEFIKQLEWRDRCYRSCMKSHK